MELEEGQEQEDKEEKGRRLGEEVGGGRGDDGERSAGERRGREGVRQ